MESIEALNTTTTMFLHSVSSVTDLRIWIFVVAISIGFLALSHTLTRGTLVHAILAAVFGLCALWGSLSLATTQVVEAAVVTVNETAFVYYLPEVTLLNSAWITIAMIIYFVILVLNVIYVSTESEYIKTYLEGRAWR
ncbi:MAG: hypothetical protein PHR28_04425 [candidate division Zixibacteria bacterium]|jgi:hypothetical protein|nr:hypothetical protein [candidate division Zixibacteria bacterium]